MPNFRRLYVPGGTYFFTVVSYRRWRLFSDPAARDLLGSTLRSVREEFPFEMFASVLLWEHLHCVWTLPGGDSDYPSRWKEIKSRFTEDWLAAGGREQPVTPAQKARRQRGVWQTRYWEHTVRDADELERCCDYIHYNPVKHGYVSRPLDWPWSSFHRFVCDGHYPENWGRSEPDHIRDLDWD